MAKMIMVENIYHYKCDAEKIHVFGMHFSEINLYEYKKAFARTFRMYDVQVFSVQEFIQREFKPNQK